MSGPATVDKRAAAAKSYIERHYSELMDRRRERVDRRQTF